MRINAIYQEPVDFLRYEGKITFDDSTGEIVIPAGEFMIFGTVVKFREERFVPQDKDALFITDKGWLLIRDGATPDLSSFKYYDKLGWVEGDTFSYIIHPGE